VEDNATRGELDAPSEADVSRMIRAEVETWKPRHGPDWAGVMSRMSKVPPTWLIYSTASAALVFILFAAFLVGSWLQIGALAPQPTSFHH